MTKTKQKDGRRIAEENEYQVLYWINRFGGLTNRQLARVVWHSPVDNIESGKRSAELTTKRLCDKRMLLKRPIITGGNVHVISQKGAKFLKEQGIENVSSRGQRDLKFENIYHRSLSNEYLIDHHLRGHEIWTEHEIQRGYSPLPVVKVGKERKIPDGLVDDGHFYHWLEVEHTPKSKKKINQLITLAQDRINLKPSIPIMLGGYHMGFKSMIFVLPNDQTLSSVTRIIEARTDDKTTFENVILDRVNMSSGLVWKGSVRGAHPAPQWIHGMDHSNDPSS
jgi:hypothetical protein